MLSFFCSKLILSANLKPVCNLHVHGLNLSNLFLCNEASSGENQITTMLYTTLCN